MDVLRKPKFEENCELYIHTETHYFILTVCGILRLLYKIYAGYHAKNGTRKATLYCFAIFAIFDLLSHMFKFDQTLARHPVQ